MAKKKTPKGRVDRAAGLAPEPAPAGTAAQQATGRASTLAAGRAPAQSVAEAPAGVDAAAPSQGWTFLTNHGHVLVCLAREPGLRVRDVAMRVGITERAAVRIVGDLVEAGYLERHRVGRRNEYVLRLDTPMRHPVEAPAPVRVLVESVVGS